MTLEQFLGQFPSVNSKQLSLTLTYLSVIVVLQKLSQELRGRLLLEQDLCFCLNKKVLLLSKKVYLCRVISVMLSDTYNNNLSLTVDVTLELPQRITLQPLQPCYGCRLRQSTGPIPALLESMSHLPTKICIKKKTQVKKYWNSPLKHTMGLLYKNNHRNIKLNLAPPLPFTIKLTHKCINNLMMKYIYSTLSLMPIFLQNKHFAHTYVHLFECRTVTCKGMGFFFRIFVVLQIFYAQQ